MALTESPKAGSFPHTKTVKVLLRAAILSGKTLTDYIDACGKEILGSRGTAFEKFPILIKFIDAKQKLSVQVHPDDEYALANEGEYGKTEVWYVLSADEGAALYYGFNRKITKDEFLARISDNTC